jgi:hypothetical protein
VLLPLELQGRQAAICRQTHVDAVLRVCRSVWAEGC